MRHDDTWSADTWYRYQREDEWHEVPRGGLQEDEWQDIDYRELEETYDSDGEPMMYWM